MELTREHLRKAKAAGACAEALEIYKPGMALSEVGSSDLRWVEDVLPAEAAAVAEAAMRESGVACVGAPPLSLLGSGSGYGDGRYGSGSGDGS